jgi:predicted metal-binding membrane protein
VARRDAGRFDHGFPPWCVLRKLLMALMFVAGVMNLLWIAV